jgi:NAD(P)-dependent dehydrogenase (short-subunit alcohol dehydrogenase family)
MLNASAYSVSKAALEMWGRNLAMELAGTGVTVNVVRPGTVDTAMQTHIRTQSPERVGADMVARFTRFHESGALIAPELPARLIMQVITGGATGEVISVNDERGQALLRQA